MPYREEDAAVEAQYRNLGEDNAYGIRHDSASALAIARSTYDVALAELSEDILAFSDYSAPGAVILNVFLCNFYEVSMLRRWGRYRVC